MGWGRSTLSGSSTTTSFRPGVIPILLLTASCLGSPPVPLFHWRSEIPCLPGEGKAAKRRTPRERLEGVPEPLDSGTTGTVHRPAILRRAGLPDGSCAQAPDVKQSRPASYSSAAG